MAAALLTLSAPAKLNLSLRIVGRRADGMHLVEGESVLINFADKITLLTRDDGQLVRAWQHREISDEDDLSMRAARLLKNSADAGAGAYIIVDKRIPLGGGLGGGSSDAAAVLRGLNTLWNCKIPLAELMELSAPLGADVPFFVGGRAAKIGGIGAPVADFTPPAEHYLVVFSSVAANTAAVYAEYEKLKTSASRGKIPPALIESENDLTQAAVRLYPKIGEAAAALHRVAQQARLSGGGATLFAAFADADAARRARSALPSSLPAYVATSVSADE